MDQIDMHREHAKGLLEKAGASLMNGTAEQMDPQLANAQAAQRQLDATAMAKIAPPQTVPDVIANVSNPNAPDPKEAFFAQANRQAETQEMARRQLAEQDARQTGPTTAELAQRVPAGGPNDMIAGPADSELYAAKIRDSRLGAESHDAAAAKRLAVQTGDVDREQAAIEKHHVDELAKQSDASMTRMQDMQKTVTDQANAKMLHYQEVQNEMSKMAAEQPKDMFGQAGVNKIMGSIAIFLGGAGVNGFHENKNLQMIQSMADRHVAAEKNKFEMLQRVGQGDQTMYGMLTQKLQSSVAVEAAMRSGYMDAYSSHLKASAAQFADKRTQLRTQQTLQAIDQQKHKDDAAVHGEFLSRANTALQLADAKEMAYIKANAEAQALQLKQLKVAQSIETEQHKRDEKVKETSFIGIKGTSSKEEHPKLAAEWGGAYNMVKNLDEAQKIMMADGNFRNARAYEALVNINLGEAKKYFNTGARLEPKEVAMMQAVGISHTNYVEAILYDGGKGLTGTEIAEGLKGIQWLIANNAFTSLKAGNPQLEVDTSDPIVGRFFNKSEQAEPEWRAQAKANYGTDKGQSRLRKAPTYEETYANSMGD